MTPSVPWTARTSVMASSMVLSSVLSQNSSETLFSSASASACMTAVPFSPCCARSLARSLISSFITAHEIPRLRSLMRSLRISHGTTGNTSSLSSSSLSGVPPTSLWSLWRVSHSSSTPCTSEGLVACRGLWICLYSSARRCSFRAYICLNRRRHTSRPLLPGAFLYISFAEPVRLMPRKAQRRWLITTGSSSMYGRSSSIFSSFTSVPSCCSAHSSSFLMGNIRPTRKSRVFTRQLSPVFSPPSYWCFASKAYLMSSTLESKFSLG